MPDEMRELLDRLRNTFEPEDWVYRLCDEAADKIEAQAADYDRVNAQAEKFAEIIKQQAAEIDNLRRVVEQARAYMNQAENPDVDTSVESLEEMWGDLKAMIDARPEYVFKEKGGGR